MKKTTFASIGLFALLLLAAGSIPATGHSVTPTLPTMRSNPGVTIQSGEYLSFETEDHQISAYVYDDSDNPAGHNFYVNSGYKTITIGGSLHPFALYIDPTVNPPLNGSVMYLVVNAGGTVSLKQVEVGAANSGGTGYRSLRVTN